MAKAHTGHLTGSDAVIVGGVPPVRRHPRRRARRAARDLGRAARTRPRSHRVGARRPGVACTPISGGTGAHMADLVAAAGLRLPPLTDATQRTAARRAHPALPAGVEPGRLRRSAGRRRAGPEDPRRDARRPATSTSSSCRSPARSTCSASRSPATSSPSPRRPTSRSSSSGDRRPAPTTRTTAGCSTAGCRSSARSATASARCAPTSTTGRSRAGTARRSPTRRREPLPAAREGAAHARDGRRPARRSPSTTSKQLLRAYGIRTTRDVLCTTRRRGRRPQPPPARRLPGRDEGVVARARAQERSRPRARRRRVGAEEVRATFDDLAAARPPSGRRQGPGRRRARVRDGRRGGVETVVGVSHDPLFGPVVMVGLGGVLRRGARGRDVPGPAVRTRRGRADARELAGLPLLDGVRGAKPADVDALVDAIMKVQRLAHRPRAPTRQSPSSTSIRWSCGPEERSPSMPSWCRK